MKRFGITLFTLVFAFGSFAQVEEETETEETTVIVETEVEVEEVPDSTRMKLGKTEIIIIENNEFEEDFDEDEEEHEKKIGYTEAHWAGIDFGFSMLMNNNFESKFDDHPYWENDAAKSQIWNLNLFEHKFKLGTDHVGITTGLGFSWASVAIRGDYLLTNTPDTLLAELDTVYTYTKNKLKASYLTVPLLLEFNTHKDPEKTFYLAAGVVGGVRLTSKVKRKGEYDGKDFTEKIKGTYSLNPFKLDAAVRLGYRDVGVFASYSLLPLFENGKTAEAYPLNFGLSFNF